MKDRTMPLRFRAFLLILAGLLALSGARMATAAQDACTDDDNTIRVNYSLYYEDYKNQSFDTALPYLRWILTCAPGFPSNSDRNFRRAVEVYEGIAMTMDDPEERRTWLDSSLYIFDTAVTTLKDNGIDADPYKWTFDKGRFIQKHAADLPDLQSEVGDLYRKAYALDSTRLQWYYLNYIITDLVQKDRKSDAIEFMDRVEGSYGSDQEVESGIEHWRGTLFTSPEERIGFLEGQLAKKPDDPNLLSELFNLYSEEGMRDKVYELAPKLMEVDPSARTYRQVAKMKLDDGDTEEAISLYQQSLKMEGGMDAAKEVYYNIGIAHQQEGRLSKARTSFRRALKEDPGFGEALIAIGDLYVSAVQSCNSFEREDRAVYWLAADYFDLAAARDSSRRAQARQRATNIRRFFPTAEDKFFKHWNVGDTFKIDYGCYTWIGETTHVR